MVLMIADKYNYPNIQMTMSERHNANFRNDKTI